MLKLKILMIDDEVDYCQIMKNFFTKKNYDVIIALNLTEGLELLHSTKPDILFLDNNLPDGQGYTHVESIVEKYPQLRIFLASAFVQTKDFHFASPNLTVWEKPLSMTKLNETF